LNINSSALLFDGLNDFVNVTGSVNNILYNFSNQFSFEVWVKPNGTNTNYLFDRSNHTFIVITPSGAINFGTINTTTTELNECISSRTLSVNNWYHLAATYNGSDKIIYINGNQNKTCTWKHNLGMI